MSREIDYEGELAVVIAQRCKDISESKALNYVAGYSVFNDVSARDLQMQTSQYMAGKALDTFAPMGPGIVLASALPDPQTLLLTTRGQLAGSTARQAGASFAELHERAYAGEIKPSGPLDLHAPLGDPRFPV